ncbi:MAG TPA: ABC transporter ATP-binding protein [Streptosporangiaceae bacterium]|jgi:putative spermidine/putrescine transport system ATP-binding protein
MPEHPPAEVGSGERSAAPTAPAEPGEPAVEVTGLTKTFGNVEALRGVDLTVPNGAFFSLLGPSGSGKTTLLRLVAGFETPTSGTVRLSGRDITASAPFERDVNTVFQDLALFPHMSVERNIEYGLSAAGVPRAERRTRVAEVLATVRLEGYEQRAISAMSGGQRQRVALARALVNRPRVLLLDEPLGALDAKLREEMQVELKAIQRAVGITFVFVTHDQAEALSMSDQVAVFSDGRVEQVGSPEEIYEHPATGFVASFVGASNIVGGAAARELLGRDGTYLIRPERVRAGGTGVPGTVSEVSYQGPTTRLLVRLDDGPVFVVIAPNTGADARVPERGARVSLTWDADAVQHLPDHI